MTKNTGGQAFPGMEYDITAGQRYHYGMQLRDYFAGQILSGYCNVSDDSLDIQDWNHKVIAKGCYLLADAMIKERGKD